MAIIHVKRFMQSDGSGNQSIKEYRVSDSPEFYCESGLHAWYDEEDAEKCCKDGWTQGLVRGFPVLVKKQFCDCSSPWVVTGTKICLCCGKIKQ